MPADKMPKMPEPRHAFYCVESGRAVETEAHEWPEIPGFKNVLLITPNDLAAHERACYLAGIEAARGCVPEADDPSIYDDPHSADLRAAAQAEVDYRDEFLANLDALGRE